MDPTGKGQSRENRKSRRRRVRGAVIALRQRAEQVCGSIQQVDGLLDRVSGVIKETRDFVEGTEARELLPTRVRRRLEQAAERLDQAKDRTESLADACDRLQKVLRHADNALAGGFPAVPAAIGLGVVLAGVGIAAAVVLSRGVIVIVHNDNCGTIMTSGIADRVPGISLPDIPTGRQEKVRIPSAFQAKFTVSGTVLTLEAFGGRISERVDGLDLSLSFWDRTPLSHLQGMPISVTGDREHLLVLRCS